MLRGGAVASCIGVGVSTWQGHACGGSQGQVRALLLSYPGWMSGLQSRLGGLQMGWGTVRARTHKGVPFSAPRMYASRHARAVPDSSELTRAHRAVPLALLRRHVTGRRGRCDLVRVGTMGLPSLSVPQRAVGLNKTHWPAGTLCSAAVTPTSHAPWARACRVSWTWRPSAPLSDLWEQFSAPTTQPGAPTRQRHPSAGVGVAPLSVHEAFDTHRSWHSCVRLLASLGAARDLGVQLQQVVSASAECCLELVAIHRQDRGTPPGAHGYVWSYRSGGRASGRGSSCVRRWPAGARRP